MPGFGALSIPATILAALEKMGYVDPTAVQELGIPPLLAGKDTLLEAQTGSGKTAAFGVAAVTVGSRGPGLRVLVLVPTRELARQVSDELRAIGTGSPFRAVAVTGGVQAERQERAIGGDVRCIVATPGRFLALIEEKKVKLEQLELVVLDEADRMLDMGFRTDIEKLLDLTQHRKQTALVSATLPTAITHLAARHLREPEHVRATPRAMPPSLTHQRLNVFPETKERALVALLQREDPQRAIVFVRTRERAAKTAHLLKRMGFAADALQGEMSHDQRRHVFDLFSLGTTRILVATDIASRGLDVPEMELVVNADIPDEPGAYTHRSGRAARFGRDGRVVTLVLPNEKVDRLRLEQETGGDWGVYKLDQKTIEAVVLPGERAPKQAVTRTPARRPAGSAAPPQTAAPREKPRAPSPRREDTPRGGARNEKPRAGAPRGAPKSAAPRRDERAGAPRGAARTAAPRRDERPRTSAPRREERPGSRRTEAPRSAPRRDAAPTRTRPKPAPAEDVPPSRRTRPRRDDDE